MEAGITNEIAFYHLFRILAAQTGNLVNINELSKSIKIKNETVNAYLAVLRKCFHIALITPFYKNLTKELTKMPKVFLMDTGMRNCLLSNFQGLKVRSDRGELWENSVFRTLSSKYKLFTEAYPDIPLSFKYMLPFSENFFKL